MSMVLSTMIRHGSRRRYYQNQQMLGLLQASTSLPITSFDNDDKNKHSSTIQNRSYHATNRNEILPFIAAGVLIGGGVYTFRTLQQIDKDWEDYYHDLEEYKAETGLDPEEQQQSSSSSATNSSSAEDLSSFFTGGTLAIDIGTSRLKLSHQPSLSKNKNSKPSVIVDREGHRSTPALAWSKDGEDILVGRLAASRSFDTRGGSIVHPQDVLLGNNEQTYDNIMVAIQQTLRDVASNALDQALGSSSTGSSVKNNSNNPLFVLDTSMAMPGSYNVRPVITYPAQSTTSSSPEDMKRYQQALNGLTSPEGIAEYVSEPVAILSGAEYYNLLPPTSSNGGPVLVVDVGGTKTQVSMVLGDEVLYSTLLPMGGDTYIDLLVSKLAADFFGPSAENDDDSTDLSAKPRLNDPTALQRLYDASTTAVHELSNKTRSDINIPYLTMDLETKQPKHLEVGMSRKVVEAEFESWLKNKLVPHLQQSTSSTSLSQALPPPTNLSSLFSSVIMSALEQTSMTPMQLRAVLVVGGGARIPLIQSSMKESVGYLGLGEVNKKMVIPYGEMLEELCVLGAQSFVNSKGL